MAQSKIKIFVKCSTVYSLMQVSYKGRRNGLNEFWTPIYSKVNIDENVDNLDINKGVKQKLKENLKKFPTFFGEG